MDTQRRSLMLGTLSTLTLGLPKAGWAQDVPMPLDTFIQFSAELCGRPPEALDRGMAQRILHALEDQGKLSRLQALYQNVKNDTPLADELRAAWFSGSIQTSDGAVLVGFVHALAWGSASFLHAPGSCGGPTGYWSEAPQTPST
ncbi:sugar dehydrogenase complex small subunit [Castellaniella sp.]|uniref:sugar dehydrogenase complex small subunit n=1 Tax=Castellaniella sp. TaxID=1955812 RepID=UPI002AFF6457|nr:sugar dehydrogenase complex small subunit [Castellaniella sp.]